MIKTPAFQLLNLSLSTLSRVKLLFTVFLFGVLAIRGGGGGEGGGEDYIT